MGAIIGKQRRYMNGMQPSEYWDEVAWPENKETLEVLRFTHDQALVVFKAFVDVDRDNSGEMSVEEFHQYLGVPQTKFSERVFGILDLDGSGALDFLEFAVGVWNYCTYDTRLITKLAFDIFDIDRKGVLDLYECDALLRMVYNVDEIEDIEGPPSGKELLAEMDLNGDGDVTIDEFGDLMDSHMYILAPAFDLQRALRQRLLGVKHWEGETRVRKVIFADYDTGSNTSWDSIREILQKRQREKEAGAAAEAERKEMEAKDQHRKHMEHSTLIHRERQMRRKRKLEAAAADKTPQDLAEEAAAAALNEACAEMDRAFTFTELEDKLKARKNLYDCFETSIHAAAAARVARKDFELHRASQEDAETMVKEAMQTKEGRARFKYQVQLYYGNELYESWTDGNKLQAAIAPMFKASDDESITTATAIKMAMAKRSDLSAPREHAHNVLKEEFQKELKEKAEEKIARKTTESEKAYAHAQENLVGVYGGPNTRWEKLVDANSQQPFWYHTESGNTLFQEPAVCHVCDEIIDGLDVRCFSCNTDRSRHNRKLYTGTSELPKLEDDGKKITDDDDDFDDDEEKD